MRDHVAGWTFEATVNKMRRSMWVSGAAFLLCVLAIASVTITGPAVRPETNVPVAQAGGELAWTLIDVADGPISPGVQAIETWCQRNDVIKSRCTYKYFDDYTTRNGIQAGLDKVAELQASDRNFIAECHHAYHGVGQRAAQLTTLDSALAVANETCQYGYIHGVLQGWTVVSSSDDVEAQYETLCLTLPPGKESLIEHCGHSIGHAVALHFGDSIYDVADMCDAIADRALAEMCIEGMIMEFAGLDTVTVDIRSQFGADPTSTLTNDQRLNLCGRVADDLQPGCWRRVFQLWPATVWHDPVEYSRRCHLAKNDASVEQCGFAYGEVATALQSNIQKVTSPPTEHAATFAKCDALSNDLIDVCITSVTIAIWRDEPLGNDPVDTICEVLTGHQRELCVAAEDGPALIVRANS